MEELNWSRKLWDWQHRIVSNLQYMSQQEITTESRRGVHRRWRYKQSMLMPVTMEIKLYYSSLHLHLQVGFQATHALVCDLSKASSGLNIHLFIYSLIFQIDDNFGRFWRRLDSVANLSRLHFPQKHLNFPIFPKKNFEFPHFLTHHKYIISLS